MALASQSHSEAGTPSSFSSVPALLKAHRGFIVIYLLLSAVLTVLIFNRTSRFELTIEMSSSTPSMAQLFYDSGRGYNESDSRQTPVLSRSLSDFRTLKFDLPPENIGSLRFDPLNQPGTFVLRNIKVRSGEKVLLAISPPDILALHQIASCREENDGVECSTVPGCADPGLTLRLRRRLRLRRIFFLQNVRAFLFGLATLSLLVILIARKQPALFEQSFKSPLLRVARFLEKIAARLSSPRFIQFDSYAIGFYAACLGLFAGFSMADLNGSSIAIYSKDYRRGAIQKTWIGRPRGTRVDEWGYVTPDILNQSLRTDRFAVRDSELGGHSVALTGNIPIRHFTTLLRPQFWSFFLLPVDYAFAVYWQCKIMILVTGVFTWLLLITHSTFWSAAGSLWYFFSPFTQWSFSWPSGLAEMIGVICWAMVLGCYLTVGRSKLALLLAAVGFAACSINFALCAYPPHLVPLLWVGVIFFVFWCISNRQLIFQIDAARLRIGAVALAAGIVAVSGLLVFLDLRQAIAAIANTSYPGKRIDHSGSMRPLLFLTHLLQWTETEGRYPAFIGNMSEGSGFIWLAPITLACFGRLHFLRSQKYALIALWVAFCLILAWLVLPLPPMFGAVLGLNRTGGARLLPALGLCNVGIVALCASSLRPLQVRRWRVWPIVHEIAFGVLAAILFFLILRATNEKLNSFFPNGPLLFAALFAAIIVTFLIWGRKRLLAIALVSSQMLAFGSVNPVEHGLSVITSSDLFHFTRRHPRLLEGKWIVFSDSPVISGFFAATGCDVYTGMHYLPDIDHFALFASNGLDTQNLNRLGYLDAHLRDPGEPSQVQVQSTPVVRWTVSPRDPILREIGITYLAFDVKPPDEAVEGLTPIAGKAIDGFWLYQYR